MVAVSGMQASRPAANDSADAYAARHESPRLFLEAAGLGAGGRRARDGVAGRAPVCRCGRRLATDVAVQQAGRDASASPPVLTNLAQGRLQSAHALEQA